MKIEKLLVAEKKFDINLKFYFFLKHLVKTKLSGSQSGELIALVKNTKQNLSKSLEEIELFIDKIKSKKKAEDFEHLVSIITNKQELEVFLFALRLYTIKDLLLAEAKLKDTVSQIDLARLDPLSIAYDKKSIFRPYSTRVNGALLSLLFFDKVESGNHNFMSKDSDGFIKRLSQDASNLKKQGLEPNQIFMLMFSESINQSIISDSGSNYEDRIHSVLQKIGIPKDTISKIHDKNDKSTEFDFFFELESKTYGIGAKRTLRERYKQFIKTTHTSKIDIMIEITLGLDLNEEKAKTILSHGTKIFVSDEIYQSRNFMKKLDGVYSVKDLNIKTLKALK